MSFERLRARADRVKQECDLGALLQEYGYAVVPDRHREQQFSCDLHGPDNKPSARLYGHNNTTYCWVCQKTRDPISYMMEKELINFREAVERLEERLGLPPLPWSDEKNKPVDVADEIEAMAHTSASYEDEKMRVGKFLQSLTTDRDLDMESLLSFWEVYDRIDYGVARQNWPENKGAVAMLKLLERIKKKCKELS